MTRVRVVRGRPATLAIRWQCPRRLARTIARAARAHSQWDRPDHVAAARRRLQSVSARRHVHFVRSSPAALAHATGAAPATHFEVVVSHRLDLGRQREGSVIGRLSWSGTEQEHRGGVERKMTGPDTPFPVRADQASRHHKLRGRAPEVARSEMGCFT